MLTMRTWEVLASGKHVDTGVDERWDSASGSYDVADPGKYRPGASHHYWFGRSADGETLTVPADEDAQHKPRRFFVTVRKGRKEATYPTPSRKGGRLASAEPPQSRPYADAPERNFDWSERGRSPQPKPRVIRTVTESVHRSSFETSPRGPARAGQSAAKGAGKKAAAATRGAKPAKATKKTAASSGKAKPKAKAKATAARTKSRPAPRTKARPAARTARPAKARRK